jgi:hypothetical protein
MNGHLKSRHKSIKFKTKNSEPENPNAPSVINSYATIRGNFLFLICLTTIRGNFLPLPFLE